MNTPLREGAIYKVNGQMLEATWQSDKSTWRLYLLDDTGNYPDVTLGCLFALELTPALEWEPLYAVSIPRIYPRWEFTRGTPIRIDPAHIEFVYESREALQQIAQVEDEAFADLMSEFEWN